MRAKTLATVMVAMAALASPLTAATATQLQPAPQAAPQPAPPVTRLIVAMSAGTPVPLTVQQQAAATAGEQVEIGPELGNGISVLEFAEPVLAQDAKIVSAVLTARADVLWAQPDALIQPLAPSPSTPDDTFFNKQWALWDTEAATAGGYGTKAAAAWAAGLDAKGTVVAVLDSGFTAHPDLDGNVIPGYDMVSDPWIANDGDGRDTDASDPGTGVSAADLLSGGASVPSGCTATNSSWHGTHVAGIIGAVRNNGIGVAGVVSNVKLQSVRATGRCGGWTSDILAAITWASGGAVDGIPMNDTPAKVINMSLGSSGTECFAGMALTIAAARARGATLVAAAGNSNTDAYLTSPANCPGVISVMATDRYGSKAAYSNYGTDLHPGVVDIAAPGGGTDVNTSMIGSTLNDGQYSPGNPAYAYMVGTSMAAPHVAAAAALLVGIGGFTPDTIEERIKNTAAPFPTGTGGTDCNTTACGTGLLDISAMIANGGTGTTVADKPTGLQAYGGDTSVTLTWTAPTNNGGTPITGYSAQSSMDNGANWGAAGTWNSTATTQSITGLTNGATYQFRVAALNAKGASDWSDPVTIVPASPTPPAAPAAIAAVPAIRSATVSWSPVVSSYPVRNYTVQASENNGGTWTTVATTTKTDTVINDLSTGVEYRFRVRATSDIGDGAWTAMSEVAKPYTIPAAPNLRATSQVGQVTLTWTNANDNGSKIARYDVQWKTSSASAFSQSEVSAGTRTVVRTAPGGTAILFRVRAVNSAGNGQWSNYVAAVSYK